MTALAEEDDSFSSNVTTAVLEVTALTLHSPFYIQRLCACQKVLNIE